MKYLPIALVYLYRYSIGLFLRPSCKYYPSCSAYSIGVLRRYGFFRGAALTVWRLARCNPWSHGGVDLPEQARLLGRALRPGRPLLSRVRHRHGGQAA